jgi:hypothetical protein
MLWSSPLVAVGRREKGLIMAAPKRKKRVKRRHSEAPADTAPAPSQLAEQTREFLERDRKAAEESRRRVEAAKKRRSG